LPRAGTGDRPWCGSIRESSRALARIKLRRAPVAVAAGNGVGGVVVLGSPS
jgi:hypothetical protein